MIIYFLMVAYVFLIGVAAKQRVVSGATISKNNFDFCIAGVFYWF